MIMEEGDRNMKQQIILVSDSTGITVEALSHSLLAQFPDIAFELTTYRYVDSVEKLEPILKRVSAYVTELKSNPLCRQPIIISTLVDGQLRARLETADAHVFDIMAEFLTPLEEILHAQASPSLGQTHGQQENRRYQNRMDAVNFALINDDGVTDKHLGRADIILIGPSRTGKTPTCLYLAMQYGIYAANYPLVEEDFDLKVLPETLTNYKERLFGLTIEPERLHEIRQTRRADSEYAALQTCQHEVRQVNRMYQENNIPVCDVTQRSIEEIATLILPHIPSMA